MREVTPGVYVESAYPPYNLVLIKTARGGIVVDLPPNPLHAVNWLEQVRTVTEDIRYVVLTDAARERQYGTMACSFPIIASETTLRIMKAYEEERALREFVEEVAVLYPGEVEALADPMPHKPAFAFNKSFVFYGGDRELRFETVAGAHPGGLWILIRELNLLIAGDTVVSGVVPPMASTPDSGAWLKTMTLLAHRAVVHSIVPGRGEALIARDQIEPQREFMRVMRRTARAFVKGGGDGLGLSQMARELGQTFFNQQGQLAVKEIKAGLAHLVSEVQDVTDPDLERDVRKE